ncbi:nucleoside diphosphate kinase regulator [Brevundimonas kwangchunensis]|uniref:Nucleoside diphosphate kinase regulator n=1 Tax=Brevundimonas kwangchunensis TaxID=322163 RepID=A0ABN1GS64_9CAUL
MPIRTSGDAPARLPAIQLSSADHALLSTLVGEVEGDGVAGLLRQELDRARIDHSGRRLHTVGLDCWVHYVDDRGSRPRRIKIVPPSEADIDLGLVSPLSHVGAGLLGLSAGQSIRWPDPSGRLRKLTAVLIEDEDTLV